MGLDAEMKQGKESGRALTKSPLCFKSSSYGELSSGGRKLIGSAQKRWTDGFLQQGAIPYSVDIEMLNSIFILQGDAQEAKYEQIIGLRELIAGFEDEALKRYIKDLFEMIFGFILEEAQPSPLEEASALQLMQRKYLNKEWTLSEATSNRFCNSRVR